MVFQLHMFKMAFRCAQIFCKIPASETSLHPWYFSVLVFIITVVNFLCFAICGEEGSVVSDCNYLKLCFILLAKRRHLIF